MDSIQIRHVVVAGFQGVPYCKMTLNTHVLKRYLLSLHFFSFP